MMLDASNAEPPGRRFRVHSVQFAENSDPGRRGGAGEPTSVDQPRRSASQVPAHSPPFQEPPPPAPAKRPEPVAVLLPWLTVTVMEPLPPTLPEMAMGLSPALTSEPFEMRIGYR